MSDHEMENVIKKGDDPLITFLQKIIIYFIKFLAILMIFIILASVLDVVYVVYDKLILSDQLDMLHTEGLLTIFGAIIGVLIGIGIFNNIVVYVKSESLQIKLVLTTALIAISRKVIILDYKTTPPEYIYAIAAIVLATALAYWVVRNSQADPN